MQNWIWSKIWQSHCRFFIDDEVKCNSGVDDFIKSTFLQKERAAESEKYVMSLSSGVSSAKRILDKDQLDEWLVKKFPFSKWSSHQIVVMIDFADFFLLRRNCLKILIFNNSRKSIIAKFASSVNNTQSLCTKSDKKVSNFHLIRVFDIMVDLGFQTRAPFVPLAISFSPSE